MNYPMLGRSTKNKRIWNPNDEDLEDHPTILMRIREARGERSMKTLGSYLPLLKDDLVGHPSLSNGDAAAIRDAQLRSIYARVPAGDWPVDSESEDDEIYRWSTILNYARKRDDRDQILEVMRMLQIRSIDTFQGLATFNREINRLLLMYHPDKCLGEEARNMRFRMKLPMVVTKEECNRVSILANSVKKIVSNICKENDIQ